MDIELRFVGTKDEVAGIEFLGAPVIPRAGERIHYWVDGTPDAAGTDSGIRRDFLVVSVEHDWRFMPGRGGPSRQYLTVILYVNEVSDALA